MNAQQQLPKSREMEMTFSLDSENESQVKRMKHSLSNWTQTSN